jgi:hypothetical protein
MQMVYLVVLFLMMALVLVPVLVLIDQAGLRR